MSHIDFFIHQLETVSRKKFFRNAEVGKHGGGLRPTAVYIVWKFNAINVRTIARTFGVSAVSVHYSINRCTNWLESKDETFSHYYNEILEFYIKSTIAYLNKNKIYNLKQVA